MRKLDNYILLLIILTACNNHSSTTKNNYCLLNGADLSYLNTIENNGGFYSDSNGNTIDPYKLFANKGAKIIRIRLWHTPKNIMADNACGGTIKANNLDDVVNAFKRAKNQGMKLFLSIHYGDYFNDAGKQKRPFDWVELNQTQLLVAINSYTTDTLTRLKIENVIPDFISIGNETISGFMDTTDTTDGWLWSEDSAKFNTAFSAIDNFNITNNTKIKKALHFTSKTVLSQVEEFKNHGVTNYDIIGFSYYPYFHNQDLNTVGAIIDNLKQNYNNKEVMILETGAIWTTVNIDNYSNFIKNYGKLEDYQPTTQGQKSFLLDLNKVVRKNGGSAVIYWEPAWISSNMCDKWGQGSSYENATLFDFNHHNTPLPAFDFFKMNICQ